MSLKDQLLQTKRDVAANMTEFEIGTGEGPSASRTRSTHLVI